MTRKLCLGLRKARCGEKRQRERARERESPSEGEMETLLRREMAKKGDVEMSLHVSPSLVRQMEMDDGGWGPGWEEERRASQQGTATRDLQTSQGRRREEMKTAEKKSNN
ncbi:uncharacterized protein MCYG_02359 [Microsporum canis CBS 113480]|uniref:Uncharacterized protein n=1 Tax=Arthroderma otae (strain ATCC MYA-4605 / CBS 113480) TaxID=554155 RepID=C5FJB9_ARTOC|nr:uncharacterized protein MCYG_02359 [Microsporum canis CBS 113480]EEQ29540.1 predicted protein [Microsporum canis CBS 113480]